MTRRGDWILALAVRLFDARTMAHVVEPAIADLQAEPPSALRYWAVFKAIALCLPGAVMRMPVATAVSCLTAVAVVALLAAPRLVSASMEGVFDPVMLLYLIPQGISFALTLALTVWIVSRFGGRPVSRRSVAFVVATAAAFSAVAFVCHGWLTPAANQAFRLAWARRAGFFLDPARGFPELTFGEARQLLSWAVHHPGALTAQNLHYLAVSYEGRLAASIAPIVFAVFALLIAPWRWWARWSGAVAAGVAYLVYLLSLGESNLMAIDGRWLGGAAWYPLIVLAIVIAALVAGSFFTGVSNAEVSV